MMDGDDVLAMQVTVGRRTHEVYWSGTSIVLDVASAQKYLSRQMANSVASRLVNKKKLLFYPKEI